MTSTMSEPPMASNQVLISKKSPKPVSSATEPIHPPRKAPITPTTRLPSHPPGARSERIAFAIAPQMRPRMRNAMKPIDTSKGGQWTKAFCLCPLGASPSRLPRGLVWPLVRITFGIPSRSELRSECVRPSREQRNVRADEHEGRSGVDVRLRDGGIERVHPYRPSRGGHRRESIVHGPDDLGVRLLPEMPHRSGEIGGADEYAVDTIDCGDLRGVLDPGRGLDLDEQGNVLGGVLQVVIDPIPPCGTRECRAYSAPAPGWVMHRRHGCLGVLGGGDHRNEDVLGTG